MSSHVLRFSLGLFCALSLASGALSQAVAAPSCPNLVFLLDQSPSMAETPAGQTPMAGEKSKWEIAVSVLTNLVNRYDGFLPIGYSNFPTCNVYPCNAGCTTKSFSVPVAYGTRQAIYDATHAYPSAYPWTGGGSPICSAVTKLAAEPALQDTARAQYIVLITDGLPDTSCCTADPIKATTDAIAAARAQSVSIRTFVVGFGVAGTEQAALNGFADAGGVPNSNPNQRFYLATDQTTLTEKLNGILSQIVGGDAGLPIACEDGCYGNGCPDGLVCIQNQCKPNACAGQTCPESQHCLFDGTSASCVADCTKPCPGGSRCSNGRCVTDPCGSPCPSGQTCNASTAQCQPDPKCQNLICHSTQGCFNGKCVDDPCVYTTCPAGTMCLQFTGQCAPPQDPNISYPSGDSGCQCGLGGRSYAAEIGPLGALIAGSILALLSRRRRRSSW